MNVLSRFVLVNFIFIMILVGLSYLGYLDFIPRLPHVEWALLVFLVLIWLLGMLNSFIGNWRNVYHFANELPIWGFIACILTVVPAVYSVTTLQADTTLQILHAIAGGISCTATGGFCFIWLRSLAYFVGEEHI